MQIIGTANSVPQDLHQLLLTKCGPLGKRKRQLPSDLTENGLPRNVKQRGQKELAEIWSGPVISVVGQQERPLATLQALDSQCGSHLVNTALRSNSKVNLVNQRSTLLVDFYSTDLQKWQIQRRAQHANLNTMIGEFFQKLWFISNNFYCRLFYFFK